MLRGGCRSASLPPIAVRQGADRISVELPGVQDEADIRSLSDLIDTTGVLEFLPVPPELQSTVGEGPLSEGMADIGPLFTGVEIASTAIARDLDTGVIVVDLQLKASSDARSGPSAFMVPALPFGSIGSGVMGWWCRTEWTGSSARVGIAGICSTLRDLRRGRSRPSP